MKYYPLSSGGFLGSDGNYYAVLPAGAEACETELDGVTGENCNGDEALRIFTDGCPIEITAATDVLDCDGNAATNITASPNCPLPTTSTASVLDCEGNPAINITADALCPLPTTAATDVLDCQGNPATNITVDADCPIPTTSTAEVLDCVGNPAINITASANCPIPVSFESQPDIETDVLCATNAGTGYAIGDAILIVSNTLTGVQTFHAPTDLATALTGVELGTCEVVTVDYSFTVGGCITDTDGVQWQVILPYVDAVPQAPTHYNATGFGIPSGVSSDWTTCDVDGKPECVKWSSLSIGIDNTGTRFNDTATYEFTLSDSSVITINQTPTAGWTAQVNQWVTLLQAQLPNALVEARCNFPAGCGGLLPAPTGVAFSTMYARYINITVCPTDPYIVSGVITASDVPKRLGRSLVVDYARTPEVRGYRCLDCEGGYGALKYEDGSEVLAQDLPVCVFGCTEAFPDKPEPLCDTFYLEGCDNLDQEDTNLFVPIIRRIQDCGDGPVVEYFTVDADGGLEDYGKVGDFVDCDTGESLELDDFFCLTPTGDCMCYGNLNTAYEGEGDGAFSIGNLGNITMKWQVGTPANGLDTATAAIRDCIDSGETVEITVTDTAGNVYIFPADAYSGGNPDGTGTLAFTGPGAAASGSGKVASVSFSCGGSGAGKACSFFNCEKDTIVWKDNVTSALLTAAQIETLEPCPPADSCDVSKFQFVLCASEDTTDSSAGNIETGDQILILGTQDCNSVILSSRLYLLSNGQEVIDPVLTEQCEPSPDVENIKDCIKDTNGDLWTVLAVIEQPSGMPISTLYYDANLILGTPAGNANDWTPCELSCDIVSVIQCCDFIQQQVCVIDNPNIYSPASVTANMANWSGSVLTEYHIDKSGLTTPFVDGQNYAAYNPTTQVHTSTASGFEAYFATNPGQPSGPAIDATNPLILTYDMGQIMTTDGFVIWGEENHEPKLADVEYSLDGTNWTAGDTITFTPVPGGSYTGVEYTFSCAFPARFIRFTHNDTGSYRPDILGIGEIAFRAVVGVVDEITQVVPFYKRFTCDDGVQTVTLDSNNSYVPYVVQGTEVECNDDATIIQLLTDILAKECIPQTLVGTCQYGTKRYQSDSVITVGAASADVTYTVTIDGLKYTITIPNTPLDAIGQAQAAEAAFAAIGLDVDVLVINPPSGSQGQWIVTVSCSANPVVFTLLIEGSAEGQEPILDNFTLLDSDCGNIEEYLRVGQTQCDREIQLSILQELKNINSTLQGGICLNCPGSEPVEPDVPGNESQADAEGAIGGTICQASRATCQATAASIQATFADGVSYGTGWHAIKTCNLQFNETITYDWGDGSNDTGAGTQSHEYATPGIYTVTATINSTGACNGSVLDTYTITIV